MPETEDFIKSDVMARTIFVCAKASRIRLEIQKPVGDSEGEIVIVKLVLDARRHLDRILENYSDRKEVIREVFGNDVEEFFDNHFLRERSVSDAQDSGACK